MFGWCLANQHEICRIKYRRFYIGPVGKGRKKKDGVIYLDEWRECDCHCHNSEDDKPKKAKKSATRRKK